eukprot:259035-Alexandrium_andersonii.AAC.1
MCCVRACSEAYLLGAQGAGPRLGCVLKLQAEHASDESCMPMCACARRNCAPEKRGVCALRAERFTARVDTPPLSVGVSSWLLPDKRRSRGQSAPTVRRAARFAAPTVAV